MESISSWVKRAKCNGVTDINFQGEDKDDCAEAKRFCIGCPVISLCKTYAIAHNEYGVWGGISRQQRLKYGEYFANQIRELYYHFGLLEYRSGYVAEFLWQKEHPEEQLQEYDSPIAL